MDIRCRKTNCKYNKDLTCLSKQIVIEKKLNCEMFEEGFNKTEKDFSSLIFKDNPPKVADYRHLKDICLSCNAKCLFNKKGHCISNGITVNVVNEKQARCITYMKP